MTTTPEGRREPLSAEERDDLRVLALRATQGPWKADGTIYEHMVSEIRSIMPGEERGIAQVWQHPQGFADARFIAAANPATVLSLLAALEEAEGREHRVCAGCGSSWSRADLDAAGKVSCCPERKMLTAKEWAARAEASERREAGLRAQVDGLRPEVLAFAHLMEAQLRANDHKPGWKKDGWGALLHRLREEADQLDRQLLHAYTADYSDRGARVFHDPKEIAAKRTAHVANFAMMIADVCGALPTTKSGDQP